MKSDPKTGALCYTCIHRGTIPGDCHSRCMHPKAHTGNDVLGEVFALLGKRMGALPQPETELHVKGNQYGINKGWFNWPFNFDPTWLEECDGYEEKE